MKKTLLFALVLGLSSITFSDLFGQSTKLKLEEGTVVRVKSMSDISSKTAKDGDLVDFVCAEDIFVNDKLVIKQNARVTASVEDAEHAKSLGKEGSLRIAFINVRAIDGQKIPLRAVRGTTEGKNTVAATVALSVVLSPLFLLKKGKEVKIPVGKMMEAYTSQDVEITIQ